MVADRFYREPAAEPRELLSPEGVFERVEREITFRVTLTEGGKLRLYVDDDRYGTIRSVAVYETREEAEKSMGTSMILHGGLITDPDGTMRAMINGLKERKG